MALARLVPSGQRVGLGKCQLTSKWVLLNTAAEGSGSPPPPKACSLGPCPWMCDAQICQIMLKLRGSTTMQSNHKSLCSGRSCVLGCRNWVKITRNMQQEGVASLLLPLPASRFRAPVLPCVEAPLSESTVLNAVAGGCYPRVLLEPSWEGVEGLGRHQS